MNSDGLPYDEDELLQEFHAAGIFTEDEIAEHQRRVERSERYVDSQRFMENLGIRNPGYALQQMQFNQHNQDLYRQQQQQSGLSGLQLGMLGSLGWPFFGGNK